VLELPTDHRRGERKGGGAGWQGFRIEKERAEKLRKLSRAEGVTMYMVLLGAFKVLLQHVSGVEDVVVGTNVANRNRVETEGLIGFFINQLVLRTVVKKEMSIGELLRGVRETTLGAYAHQDVPFDVLVAEIQPERTGQQSPLFQVKFDYGEEPAPPPLLTQLAVQPLNLDLHVLRHDLHLFIRNDGQEIDSVLVYDNGLFEPESIDVLLKQYSQIVTLIAEKPDLKIRGILLLLQEQDRQRRQAAERELEERQYTRLKTIKRKSVVVQ
jgi:non-ribosomal peptide synthetase component F